MSLKELLIAFGIKERPRTTITPYFFGPNERQEYIINLQDLEEQGAEIAYSKWDELNGGVIHVMTIKQ